MNQAGSREPYPVSPSNHRDREGGGTMTNRSDRVSENAGAIATKNKKLLENIRAVVMPDYDYWWKMDYWELEEACLLLLGIDPKLGIEIIDYNNIKRLLIEKDQISNFADQSLDPPIEIAEYYIIGTRWAYKTLDQYNKIKGLAERSSVAEHKASINDGTCGRLVVPSEFIIWVRGKGYAIAAPLLELIPNAESAPLPLPDMKKDNPYYSVELEMAISAWMALYQNNKILTNRGNKEQIREWIKKHYPKATQGAIERIAKVVNPNKKGGAPSTD